MARSNWAQPARASLQPDADPDANGNAHHPQRSWPSHSSQSDFIYVQSDNGSGRYVDPPTIAQIQSTRRPILNEPTGTIRATTATNPISIMAYATQHHSQSLSEVGSEVGSWDVVSPGSISSPSADSPSGSNPDMLSPQPSHLSLGSAGTGYNPQGARDSRPATVFDMFGPETAGFWGPTHAPHVPHVSHMAHTSVPLEETLTMPMEPQSQVGSFEDMYAPIDMLGTLGRQALQPAPIQTSNLAFTTSVLPQGIPALHPFSPYPLLGHPHNGYTDPVPHYVPMATRTLSHESQDSSLNNFLASSQELNWSVIQNPELSNEETQAMDGFEHITMCDFLPSHPSPVLDEPRLSPEDLSYKFEDSMSPTDSLDAHVDTYDSAAGTSGSSPEPEPSERKKTSENDLAIRNNRKQKVKNNNRNNESLSPQNTSPPSSQHLQHTFDPAAENYTSTHYHMHHGDEKPYSKKVGGRPRGKHLEQGVAARARHMREVGACWNCCLQREMCSGNAGEPCNRCESRRNRGIMESGWSLSACSRTKMPDLREDFIPDIVTRFHKDVAMQKFFEKNIQTFVHGSTYTLEMLAIWTLPRLKCELYEFQPIGDPLGAHMTLHQGKFEYSKPKCIPLALSQTCSRNAKADLVPYEKYVQELIDGHLKEFADICYKEMDDTFMDGLLHLLVQYRGRDAAEDEVLTQCFRMLIAIHIYTHAISIPRDQFHLLKSRLHPEYIDNLSTDEPFWYPRVANRQLKYFFLQIAMASMDQLLGRIQRILSASSGKARWISAFVGMLSLGMALEELQSTIMFLCSNEAERGMMTEQHAEETWKRSCVAIDTHFLFMTQLFQGKFGKTNPLRDGVDEVKKNLLGEKGTELVLGIKKLVEEHSSQLFHVQYESPLPSTAEKFYARLCSRFVSSFYWPGSPR